MTGMLRFCAVAGALWFVPAVALAATNPLAAASKKHDTKTPIEITSDALDVMQEQNQAIFSGHVVAVQGDVRLKADTMTVYYAAKAEGAATPKAANPEEAGAIKKIDVNGNVFLSTAEETASGARGTYDVANNVITLDDGVVLTRGQNTLKGDHLVYDFASGKSQLSGGQAATVTDAGGKPRVRALFVPEKKEGEKKGEKK